MKKMKRFLSLLICMVMLMSFLPMGASATNFDFVTINVPIGTYQDAGTIVSKISAKGSRYGNNEDDLNVTSTVTGTTYDNGEDIVFVTLSLTPKDGDTFKHLSDRSNFLYNQVSVNSGVNKSETSINSNKTVLTVKLSFRVTHKDHIFSDETDVDCICGFNRGVKVTFNSEKGTPSGRAHSLKWLCYTIVFYTGIVIQWTYGSLMYALPQALPFHPRAGATVCCGCSLLTGENSIDDLNTPILGCFLLFVFSRANSRESSPNFKPFFLHLFGWKSISESI